METIKVNMTPCEDIKTIHASQNDNEAREWGFELHNNGEKIDSSSISDQLVFKAYEGGTEEILPTNGSTPTTSPFKGDIKYPQGLLSDQEFLYRESQTEEDGLAKITDIKGNTLVWNQLVQNGNFADTSVWQNYGSTFTVSGNTATVKTTNASTQFGIYQPITFKANHKYFISFEAKKHGTITLKRNRLSSGQEQVQEGLYRTIETASSDYSTTSPIRIIFSEPVSDITNDYFMVKNYMIVDLTQMGLDSITVEQFTSLFSKPYYDYCQGAMLSFGCRNVKFNQLVNFSRATQTVNSVTFTNNNDGSCSINGTSSALALYQLTDVNISLVTGHKYLYKGAIGGNSNIRLDLRSTSDAVLNESVNTGTDIIFTSTATGLYKCVIRVASGTTVSNVKFIPQLLDLTEMFGVGNEPSAEGFLELFPNDYYEYTTGQYMNLGQPVSLKTTGKNLIEGRGTGNIYNGGNLLPVKQGQEFWIYADYTTIGTTNLWCGIFSSQSETSKNTYIADMGYFASGTVKKLTASKDGYIGICYGSGVADYTVNKIMLSFASFTADEYEPYTESVLSIPLDEFPNGMDGVNDVRDYKNETGYGKVIGEVDLGSMQWTAVAYNNITRMRSYDIKTSIKYPSANNKKFNGVCTKYDVLTANNTYDGQIGISCQNNGDIYVYDSAYSTADAFKQAMQGVILKYELSAPLENYGVVDLGTLDWIYNDSFKRFHSTGLSNLAKFPSNDTTVANILSNEFATVSAVYFNNNKTVDKLVALSMYGSIYARNLSMTDVNEFKSSLSGVYLLYEKQNPQGFTTATLVTENGEVALANENGVLVGKCNSDVSADAGFIEGKIKLADEDGECYSNKIQLHIERKPS